MSQDIFVPQSKPEDALVEQLHTVTYVTSDKEAVQRAFELGYELEFSGWHAPEGGELVRLREYFCFPENSPFEIGLFHKSGAGKNVQVRVIATDTSIPQVRTEYDGLITSGATISFPKLDLYAHEKKMLEAGFESTIGVKEMEFQSPTGEVYISAETIFYGPENSYLLAVKRPDIFVPVGPVDQNTGVGGAAYSARCIDNADAVIEFFKSVLGYEIRRDVTFEIGEKSALLLPQGAQERFIQAFAPGSSSAYLVFMDHGEHNRPSTAPTLGPACRGISMWSFRTKDLDEVYARLQRAGVEVVSPPSEIGSPYLNNRRAMIARDPQGFPIEIFAD